MTSVIGLAAAPNHTLSGHPENAGRMAAIQQLLEESGVLADLMPVAARAATTDQVGRVHTPELIDRVRLASWHELDRLDPDTYVTAESFGLALVAAGTVCATLDEIATGRARNGLALVRPPGHHANQNRAGGFCLFNNVAIAARQAQAVHGLQRVLILDFDVHHGNGTQDIFYEDPGVLFISLHLFHHFFYPGTGAAQETGRGAGQGATVNVPFPPGAGDRSYRQAFRELIGPRVARFRPQMVLVSAGFDAHWSDPLAAADLSLAGYAQMTRDVLELAQTFCDGRALFVLEGGYQPVALAHGVLNVAYALSGRDLISDPLGPPPAPEQDYAALLAYLRQLHLRD